MTCRPQIMPDRLQGPRVSTKNRPGDLQSRISSQQPASSRTRIETLEKVKVPSRGGSGHQQTTPGNVVDPRRSARKPGKSTPNGNISPSRDPRLRRSEELTPLASASKPMQISSMLSRTLPAEPRMLGEPPTQPFRDMPVEVGATASQASVQHGQIQSHSSHPREAHVSPALGSEKEAVSQAPGQNDDDDLHPQAFITHDDDDAAHLIPTTSAPTAVNISTDEAIAACWKAFADEELVKQAQHEAEMSRLRSQQELEMTHELTEKMRGKREDADAARKAAVRKQQEAHERRMAELRRR